MPIATLYAGLAVATAVAAVWDVTTRRIPNPLTIALILGSVGARGVLFGWTGAAAAAATALCCLVGGTVAYQRGWLGGGDVKLIAGAAAAFGPDDALSFLLYTGVCGGLLALAWTLQRHRFGRRIPYALAAAAGVSLVILSHSALPALRIAL